MEKLFLTLQRTHTGPTPFTWRCCGDPWAPRHLLDFALGGNVFML